MPTNTAVHEILLKATMPNGCKIQLENWHPCYPTIYAPNSTVAVYVKSPYSVPGRYIWVNADVRFELDFPSESEAMDAYNRLWIGEANLRDYLQYICEPWKKQLLQDITQKEGNKACYN